MGRFTSNPATEFPIQNNNYQTPSGWPNTFPKPVVGLGRDGVIVKNIGKYITSPDQVQVIEGSLEAIRNIRLKGYKVVILSNQGGIQTGLQTVSQVDTVNQYIMQLFGQAGILTIDGLYYSMSTMKEDEYVKPNVGMFKKAEREMPGVDFSTGWFVGDEISDLKAAERIGAKPILVKTGNGEETLQKLNTFANKSLKKDTKVFNNLLEFSQSLA